MGCPSLRSLEMETCQGRALLLQVPWLACRHMTHPSVYLASLHGRGYEPGFIGCTFFTLGDWVG